MAKSPKTTPAAPAVADTAAAPSASDVSVVVDAAKGDGAPADAEEVKAKELADATNVAEAAAAAGAAPGAGAADGAAADGATSTPTELDAARDAANEQAAAENEQPREHSEALDDVPEFPCVIRVMNNSSFPLVEKVSGRFIAAGSIETIPLHDRDHAVAVSDSLAEQVATNLIPREQVVVTLA